MSRRRRLIFANNPRALVPPPPCEARGCGKPSACVMMLEGEDVSGDWYDIRSNFLCAEHEAKARKRYEITPWPPA